MTKPIPDKAEVALEYPDKLYIGTFEQSARFDAHLDETGISLSLHRTGADDVRKSIRMHFHYGLFADILRDLAKTVSSLPASDLAHRAVLRDAAQALYSALQAGDQGGDETSGLTAKRKCSFSTSWNSWRDRMLTRTRAHTAFCAGARDIDLRSAHSSAPPAGFANPIEQRVAK